MKPIVRLLVVVALLAVPVAASWADPPPWAPAHGERAKHRYVYYPSHQIYFEPAQGLWFWLDGGNWQFGASLPVYYRQYTTGGVRIELDTDRPYTQHSYVVEQYGAGKPGRSGYGGKPGKSDKGGRGNGNGGKGKGHD